MFSVGGDFLILPHNLLMTHTSESESSEATESVLPSVADNVPVQIGDTGKKLHFCDYSGCEAKFSRPWRLAAHKAVHLGKRPFHCDYEGCNKAYTSNYHLRRHKLSAHANILKNELYKCPFPGCNKEFKFIQNQKKHFRRTHEEKTCKICGEQFFKNIQLKKHLKIHKTGYLFECSLCELKFEHQFLYNRHMRKHWIHACPVKNCSASYHNWSNLRKHLSTHPYDFVCAYCKKGYRSKKYLKSHIINHLNGVKRKQSELKKVECSKCQTVVLGKASLRRHIRVVHEKIKVIESPKVKKERIPRKDKGIPKRAFAAVLSDLVVPKEIEQELIISGQNTELVITVPCS